MSGAYVWAMQGDMPQNMALFGMVPPVYCRYLKWPLNMCLVYCVMSKAHSDPLNATLRQRLCWNIQAVHDVNQLLVRKHDR